LLSFVSIINQNVRCKTIKFLEDNIGEKLDDIGYDDEFLETMPKASFMEK